MFLETMVDMENMFDIMLLSGLFKNDIAVEVNAKIINAFVAIRKYISTSNGVC